MSAIRRSLLLAAVAVVLFPARAEGHTPGCNTNACDSRTGNHIRWHIGGATTFGGPGDSGTTGTTGYRGDDLSKLWQSFAELGNGGALGHLPHGARLRILIPSTGRKLTLIKRDIGLGGGPIGGLPRVIDLWWMAAKALGVGGVWSGRVLYRHVP